MKTSFGDCFSSSILVFLTHYTFLKKEDGGAKTPISGGLLVRVWNSDVVGNSDLVIPDTTQCSPVTQFECVFQLFGATESFSSDLEVHNIRRMH